MNNRLLLTITISLGAVALLIGVFDAATAKKKANWNLPEDRSLIQTNSLRQTRKIEFRHQGEVKTSILVQDDQRWVIPEYYSMSVDDNALNRFVTALQGAEITRFVTRKSEKVDQLDVGDDELCLYDDSDHLIESIKFGKSAKNGGVFLSRNNEGEVYLSDFDENVSRDPSMWARKGILDADISDVKKVEINWLASGADMLAILRENPEDDFAIVGDEDPSVKLKVSELESFLRALLNARINNISDVNDVEELSASFENGIELSLNFFDDSMVSMKIGRNRKEVASKNEEGEVEVKEEFGPVYAVAEGAGNHIYLPKSANELVLEFSSYTFTSLPKSKSDCIEEDVQESDGASATDNSE